MGARPLGRQRTLRDEIIRMYEKRLPKAFLDGNADIASRSHMYRQLERLRAGENVQLHRFGELNYLPVAHRPERLHSLWELRGDELTRCGRNGPVCLGQRNGRCR